MLAPKVFHKLHMHFLFVLGLKKKYASLLENPNRSEMHTWC